MCACTRGELLTLLATTEYIVHTSKHQTPKDVGMFQRPEEREGGREDSGKLKALFFLVCV